MCLIKTINSTHNLRHVKILIINFAQTHRQVVGSRITLTSPDPSSAAAVKSTEESTVYSDSDSVVFVPKKSVEEKKVEGTVETVDILDDNDENLQLKRAQDEL